MSDSECVKKTKESILAYAANIIKGTGRAAGCAVYAQFAATFNAAIGTAGTSISAYLNLVRPVFALDRLILNTFVIPPLNAVISAGETLQREVIGPLAQIGATDNSCGDTAAVSKSVGTMNRSMASDTKNARNKRDNMLKYQREDSALEKQLNTAVNLLNDLGNLLPASCEDFKKMYPEYF
jgi:hypothetical protein